MERTAILTCALVCSALAAAATTAAQAVEDEAAAERWGAELGLSLNSSGGNERLTVLTTDVGLTRLETTAYELSFVGRLRYGRSEGTEVARNLRGILNAELWPGERWSPFVFVTSEHDPFRRLDLRLSSGTGIKRTFWRDGWSDVSLSGAILYEHERLTLEDTAATDVTHAARWSVRARARHQVREGTRVEQVVFYQPAWARVSDYLLESRTSARVALGERLALTTNLLYQRDSTPPPDVVPDDWSIAIGLSLATNW